MTIASQLPASLLSIDADELVALAKQIRNWQESRQLSDNELLRRLPGLGSTKTFTRVLRGDLAELDLQRWVSDYRAVLAVCESLTGRERGDIELYEDLSTVISLRRALTDIFECRSIRRVILAEGDSGLGKTSALTFMQRKWGQRLLIIEATIFWADNPNALLGAILDALGVKDQPLGREGRLRMVTGRLKQARTALAIDEAHHMGPNCLNSCKTLVNQTPGEVVLFALPTLWRRLERGAYEEVKQLLGNRLAERIKLGELRAADVKKLLSRRIGHDDPRSVASVMEQAVRLAKEGKPNGNLSFVDAVCERVTDQGEKTITHEAVLAAIAAELARR
jgi:type II secretory pathway predicted ATPase ExeA